MVLALLVLLFLTGLLLLALEAFVVPGFGLLGLAGLAAIFGSLAWAKQYGPGLFASFLGIFLVLGGAGYLLWRRFGPGNLVLSERLTDAGGYVASADFGRLLGAEGRTLTPLRPAGTAEFNGERVAVVSRGEFIPAGRNVRVIRVEGQRVVVAEIR
ncbi:MAG: hypothetical protein PWQ41_125 [Bacillota bacterium]|jgi:membrane-bound serine protease (ClpP class)|nr:hypothetical protein [Bacillota bacterium]MDK2882773.1 hypothetical protein [Bacillota bacterium]MDK2924351.1 hypothetical protein [Bacillota bacterium]